MDRHEFRVFLYRQFPGKVYFDEHEEKAIVDIEVIYDVLKICKDFGYDFLSDVTSVDYKTKFEVVYQLFSFSDDRHLTLKVEINDYENPVIESAASIWKTADWHEREIYDLMGIRFKNHPNLKRILMWEGYTEHPLRKSFKTPKRERTWEVE